MKSEICLKRNRSNIFDTKTGVIIACLRLDGKMKVVIELLKPGRRKSEKISALPLIIFVRMSVS